MVDNIIRFPIGKGEKRPSNNFKQRLLLKLYSIPIFHRIK